VLQLCLLVLYYEACTGGKDGLGGIVAASTYMLINRVLYGIVSMPALYC